ncbi:MAG: LemA family protein [Erysipelothrix sp.]|nr:LemA family protein [Erysipelothrix sp.]
MIYVFGIIIVVIGLVYINVFNRIKQYEVKVKEASANIDVALQKRYTVISQLFEVAKGYAKYEKEVIVSVVEIREGMTVSEKEKVFDILEADYARVRGLIEHYPDLKGNDVFLKLQEGIVDTEEHLAAARRLYNANVSRFNQAISKFPGNIITSVDEKEYLSFS